MNGEERSCVNISQERSLKNVSKRTNSDELSTPTRRSTRIQKLQTSNDSCNKVENNPLEDSPSKKFKNESLVKSASSVINKVGTSSTLFQVEDEEDCFESFFDDMFDQRYSKTVHSLLPKNSNKDSAKEKKFFKKKSSEYSTLNFSRYICNTNNLPAEDVSKVFKIISKPNIFSDITTNESKCSLKPALKTYSNKRRSFQKTNVIESFGLPDHPIAPEHIQPVIDNELDVANQDVNEITVLDVEYVTDPWIITTDGENLLPISEDIRKKSKPAEYPFMKNTSFFDFSDSFESFIEPRIFTSTPLNDASKNTKSVNQNKEIDIEAIKKNFKKMLNRANVSEPVEQIKKDKILKKKTSLVRTNISSADSDVSFSKSKSLIVDNRKYKPSNNCHVPKSNNKRKNIIKHNSTCNTKITRKKLQTSVRNAEGKIKNPKKIRYTIKTLPRKQKISLNKEKVCSEDVPKKFSETDNLTSYTKCDSDRYSEQRNHTKSIGEYNEGICEGSNSDNKRILRSSNNLRNLKLAEVKNDDQLNDSDQNSTKKTIDGKDKTLNEYLPLSDTTSKMETGKYKVQKIIRKMPSSHRTKLKEVTEICKISTTKKSSIRPSDELLEHTVAPLNLNNTAIETINQQNTNVSDVKVAIEKCNFEGESNDLLNDGNLAISNQDILHENELIEKLLLPLKKGKKSIPEITVILSPLKLQLNEKSEYVKQICANTSSVTEKKLHSTKVITDQLKSDQSKNDILSNNGLDTTTIQKKNEVNEPVINNDTVEAKKAPGSEKKIVKASQKKVFDIEGKRKDTDVRTEKSEEVDTEFLCKDKIGTSINSLNKDNVECGNVDVELGKSNVINSEITAVEEQKTTDVVLTSFNPSLSKETELHNSSLSINNEQKLIEQFNSVKNKRNTQKSNTLEMKFCNIDMSNIDDTIKLSESGKITDTNAENFVDPGKLTPAQIPEQKIKCLRKKETVCLKINTKHQNNVDKSTNCIGFQKTCDMRRMDNENVQSTDILSDVNQTAPILKSSNKNEVLIEKHNLDLEKTNLVLLTKEEDKILFNTSVIGKMDNFDGHMKPSNDSIITPERIGVEEHKKSDLSVESKKILNMMSVETKTYPTKDNSNYVDVTFQPTTEEYHKCNNKHTEVIVNTKLNKILETALNKRGKLNNGIIIREMETSLNKHKKATVKCNETRMKNSFSNSTSEDVSIEIISSINSEKQNYAASNGSKQTALVPDTTKQDSLFADSRSDIDSKRIKKTEKVSGVSARLKEKRKKLLGVKAVSAEDSLKKRENQSIRQSTSLAKTNEKLVTCHRTVDSSLTLPLVVKRKPGRPRKSDVSKKSDEPLENIASHKSRGRSTTRRKSLDDMDLLNRFKEYKTNRLKRSKSVARSVLEMRRKPNNRTDLESKIDFINSHTRKKDFEDVDLLTRLKEMWGVKTKPNTIITSGQKYKTKSSTSGSEDNKNSTDANTKEDSLLDKKDLSTRYNILSKTKDKSVIQTTLEIIEKADDQGQPKRTKKLVSDYTEKPLYSNENLVSDDNTNTKVDDELPECNVNRNLNVKEVVHVKNTPLMPKKRAHKDGDEGCFKVGDITWAQIGYHPFWPCLITCEPGTKFYKKILHSKRNERESYHVHFFGDNFRRAWISKQKIMLYSNHDDLQILRNKVKSENKIPKGYLVKQKALEKWKSAIEEAEQLKLKTVSERLLFFTNMLSGKNLPKQNASANTSVVPKDTSSPIKRRSNEHKKLYSDIHPTEEKGTASADVSKNISLFPRKKSYELKNLFFDGNSTKGKEPTNTTLLSKNIPVTIKRKSNEHKNIHFTVDSLNQKETGNVDTTSNITSASLRKRSNEHTVFSKDDTTKEAESPNTDVSLKRKSNENHGRGEAKSEIPPSKSNKDSTDERTPVNTRQKKKVVSEHKVQSESTSENAKMEANEERAQIQNSEEAIQLNESYLTRMAVRKQIDEISEIASKSSSDLIDTDTSLDSMEAQKVLYKRNNLFKGLSRDKVCQYCLKPGEVLKCRGRCNGSYHISCSLKILEEFSCSENKQTNNIKNVCTIDSSNESVSSKIPEVADNVKSDEKIIPSNDDLNCHEKETCVSSLKGEEQVQIITVPSSVYNTPPRKTFPPDFKNMTLAEQIDYKMKEIMRKFETKTFYSELSSESISEDVSRAQSLSQTLQIGPVTTSLVNDNKSHTNNMQEVASSEINNINTITVLDDIKKLSTGNGIEKQTGKKLKPIVKKNLFVRHITADSDRDIIELKLDDVKKNFKCGFCTSDLYPHCFVCHLEVSKKGSNIRQKCSVYPCGRFYHPECLKMWPQTQWSLIQTTRHKDSDKDMDSFVCPLHVCHTCVSDDPRAATARCSGDKIVKCLRCPSTYHSSNLCVPAGTTILSSSQIICPRHREAGKFLTINTTWCFLCSKGGNLICCETCPTSVHPECLPVNLTDDDKFICEDCESGRLPLYDEIVWVKLGKFRWWPALILFPNEVPDNVKNMKHGTGEFVVKFFGTYDHYWVNRGRSFLFQEGDTGQCSSVKKKVDMAFNRAVDEAVVAHKLKKEFKLSKEVESITSLKPPPYIRIKVNKPVGNVRHLDLDLSSTNACECDPNKPHPCGPESDCLNRLLLTECNPEVCPAGTRCKNQSFEKREYPPLVPYKTQGRGWGLKTLAPIKKGQFVIEYVGELIDIEEYQRRIQKMHEQKEENYYFLTIDKDRMIDAGPKGNAARFMNHCCQPNCETQKWTVNGDTRVGLFATEDIPVDTELTFNYNLECVGKEKKVCRCGAPNCSGFIGVKAKQDTDTKKPKRSIKKKVAEKPVALPPCFICGKRKLVVCCNNKVCNKAYHPECLNSSEPFEANKFICPWHNCNICSKRTIRCCVKCINSYCPSHADGNIRYDNLLGFVCNTHDPTTPPNDVQRIRLRKKRIAVITEETAVTSTTSDIDESDDWLPKLTRRSLNLKQSTSNNVESNNDSIVGRKLKKQSLVSDYESQDEGAVSSATLTDTEEKVVVKRKRRRLKHTDQVEKKIRLSNEQSIGITASSSTVDVKLINHSSSELTGSNKSVEN